MLQIKAFINVKMDPSQKNELYEYVKGIDNVIQCDCVTGDYEIFMEVLFHNTVELDQFIDDLQKFDSDQFVNALFTTEEGEETC